MRILVLTPFYRPGVGGSGQLVDDVCQYLYRCGHSVVVLTYSSDSEAEARFDPLQSFPIRRIAAKGLRGAGSVQTLLALVSTCVRFRPDVVFCGAAFPTAIIALAARLFLIPVVVYSHGEDVSFAPSQRRLRRICGWALARAYAVIANSSFSARQAQDLLPDSSHVAVIHPWIDSQHFGPRPAFKVEQCRRALGLQGRRVLLTVARLEERKGHDCVVNALPYIAEKVPDISYLIIGEGNPARILNIAERLGVEERVRVIDHVSIDDLPAYYWLCDVYIMVPRRDVHTGLVEGFGMVYVEAAAAGKPTIAGTHGGCRDAIADGETGLLVDPEDPGNIAEAAISLFLDPDWAEQMGSRGRTRARSLFAPDRQLARLADVIANAAKSR